MIEKVEMYTVVCDNCGEDLGDHSDYSAWMDGDQARNVAIDSEWHTYDNEKNEEQHICPNCFKGFDDDDKIIIDETRTKAVSPCISK